MSGCLKAFLIVLAIGAVVGIGSCVALVVAVDDASDDVTESEADEARDVGEPECKVDDAGFMQATMQVTNNSSKRSNYTIEVTFENPGGDQIDTGAALVSALEPDQSTAATAQTLTQPPGDFTCRIVDIERFSDVG
jgi:hypothetical protein